MQNLIPLEGAWWRGRGSVNTVPSGRSRSTAWIVQIASARPTTTSQISSGRVSAV
jgi:hypothetical protein